ncbi:hypothetical protein [Methanocella paludicola]|nr:hypothetical protein [Methanocella paludicola]
MTGHIGHHEGCGCPMCAGAMAHRKKLVAAMVFFGVMAVCSAMIAGAIHLLLHAIACRKE